MWLNDKFYGFHDTVMRDSERVLPQPPDCCTAYQTSLAEQGTDYHFSLFPFIHKTILGFAVAARASTATAASLGLQRV